MRVGLTGASGLIGHALRGVLEERGDTVVAFTRSPTPPEGPSIRWDPARGTINEDDLHRAGDLAAVVHLAGAGIGARRWSNERKRELTESRVQSTDTLCRALIASGRDLGIFVAASAVGWYGSRGEQVLDESSSPGEGFLAELCRHWEVASAPLAARAIPVAWLRSGVVVSANGGLLASQLPLFRRGLGGRLGPGTQWMSLISLLDEVRAILWVIDERLSGPLNLTTSTPITNRDFTVQLATALHRPAPWRVPAVALRVALGTEMANELALASQRVVPRALHEAGFVFQHPDFATALAWALENDR